MIGPRPFLLALACLLTVVPVPTSGAAPQPKLYPLASLQRAAYQVNITGFQIDGAVVPAPATPCSNPKIPTACTVVKAGEDAVLISYGPSPAAPVPKGALVSIFACYSNVSSFNRPWRANSTAKNILTDRACKYKIKANATAEVAGTAVFHPPEENPTSTLLVRAYVYSAPNVPYGYANAPQGFFGVERFPTPSHSVKSAAIGMAFAGPVFLALGLTLDTYLTKRRKSR